MDINLIAAAIFFLLGVLVLIRNWNEKDNLRILWLCDFSPFLLAIGFLIGNAQFIKSVINVGLFAQSIALIFTFAVSLPKIFSGKKLQVFSFVVELIIHLAVIAALILTYRVAPNAESLAYSFLILLGILIFTRSFTEPKYNVNLVYSPIGVFDDDSFDLYLPAKYYEFLWIFYAFAMVLVTFLIQYLLYKYV